MPRKRLTKHERYQKLDDANANAWKRFQPKLQALRTLPDAMKLIAAAPAVDSPGRGFYANLSVFLQDFTIPSGSTYEEKSLYLKFIERLDATGSLKPGAGKKIEQALRLAMDQQRTSSM